MSAADSHHVLRRRLNLPLLVLYGTGVTIGAGIYVLIGEVASHAGRNAPLAFVLAAVVMGLTVGSYAELCTRYPVAAGEAAYVRAAFANRTLSTMTGLFMLSSAIIASATVALGSAGYLALFLDWPRPVLVSLVILVLAVISAWGVLESVLLASFFTVIEVGGLGAIIVAAIAAKVPIGDALLSVPSLDSGSWLGVAFASVIAYFAFIGFEDLTNMVEETKSPERNVPLSMAITLVISTALYAIVAAIAVTAVPLQRLIASDAPLSMVYQELAGIGPSGIAVIAIIATLNTIIAQMTMATRVVYGMARQGDLPRRLGHVHGPTATPLLATATIAALVLALTFVASIERLAVVTSMTSLIVFALVNLALLRIRMKGAERHSAAITMPLIVPILGLATSLAMIVSSLVSVSY